MKPPPFDYVAPETLEEAVALKAERGDEAVLLAGGQSLVPLLALRLAGPATVIDLNRVPGLDHVREERGSLVLGAMARHRDVEVHPGLSERFPPLADAVPLIGHRAIRNRGTVGGSLAHADPAAEWPGLAVGLDAELEAVGPRGARTIAASGFFHTFFTNALEPDEILREVRVPALPDRGGSAFVEHARRHGDFALAGVAAVLSFDRKERVSDARIALLGMAGTPVRAAGVEDGLRGERLTAAAVDAAASACRASVDPPDDLHGTAAYRRHLVGVLAGRALRLAGQRAGVSAA